jgi:hypothetical protein
MTHAGAHPCFSHGYMEPKGETTVLTPTTDQIVAWFQRDKERERFYLLPGMGGRALRRKQKVILKWSIAAGLLVSGLLAGLLYLISRSY